MVNWVVSVGDNFQLPAEVQSGLRKSFAPVGALSANTKRLTAKLYAGQEDAAILVIGDSTGVPVTRWVYLMSQRLAVQYPAYTVIYHLWDPTGLAAYDTGTAGTPTTIQTGTGSKTLHVWNFSVSGQSTWFGLASRYPVAITAVDPDLIIVNHGKNEQYATIPTGQFAQGMWRGQMLALTERVRVTHPEAGMLLTLQCLNIGNAAMSYRNRVYSTIAQERGYGLLNVDGAYLATGHPNDFMKPDGIHPTDAGDPYDGSALWTDVVMGALRYDPTATTAAVSQQQSAFLTEATQQLPNGGFGLFTGSVPDSWTAVNATTTKDVRPDWFEPGLGYGVRIQAASAAGSYIQNLTIPVERYRGRWVTLRVRMKIAAAAMTTSSARISLTDSVTQMTTDRKATAVDGFFDQIVSMKVSDAAPYLRVLIYADSGANGAADVTVSRADLILGTLPKSGIVSGSGGSAGPAGPAGPPGSSTPDDLDFMSTFGGDPMLFLYAVGGYGCTVANSAILVKFRPQRDVSVSSLEWMTSTVSSGNYDIGIYDVTGTRLWAKGSTAWPTASTLTVETVSPAVAMTAGTTYFIAFVGDNTAGLFRGQAESFTNQIRSVTGDYLSKVVAAAFPLPAAVTIATPGVRAARYPAISIHGT